MTVTALPPAGAPTGRSLASVARAPLVRSNSISCLAAVSIT